MLPLTHFLIAFLLGLIGVHFNYFSYSQAFFIGFLSMFIDIDHLFSFYWKHKMWSLRDAWNAAVVKHEQEKSFIQHPKGLFFVSLFLLILFFLDKTITLLVAIAYYTHYLLDHLHIKTLNEYRIKNILNFSYPFNYFEFILNLITLLLLGYLSFILS